MSDLDIAIVPFGDPRAVCVVCMASPQVGGTGACSYDCLVELYELMEEGSNE